MLWLAPAMAARLGAEDGVVENMTALLLFIAAVIMAVRGVRLSRGDEGDSQTWILLFFAAFLFFILAGEEISWGQRIFSLETGEFMQQYNWQNEVNFHNLQTDASNIAFHYGAFIILVIAPLFRSRILQLIKNVHRLSVSRYFIAPAWLAIPSFVFLGMLDSRFVYTIEKPWAAGLYLLALASGVVILLHRFLASVRLKNTTEAGLLVLSLLLILIGLFVSYVYAVDEQATNIISEYKEFIIALGICIYSLLGIDSKEE